MKKLISVALLLSSCQFGAFADDNKAELSNLLRNERYYLESMVLDRLVEIDASPQWWERINDPTQSGQYSTRTAFRVLVHSLMDVAKNMGWGDLSATDYSGGYNGSSPLLPEMVDSWKGKLSLKVVLKDEPKTEDGLKASIANLDYLANPVSNDYYNHPRSGKFLMYVQLDAKQPKAKYTWDKARTTFTVVIPAYGSVSQSEMERMLNVAK